VNARSNYARFWPGLAVAILLLGACASVPRQEFDKQAQGAVKKIALLQVPEPKEISVINIGGASGMFGLIGGLAQAGDIQSKTNQYTDKMRQMNLQMGAEIAQALQRELKKQNYETVYLSDQRPAIKNENQADYSAIRTDADAILDVWYVAVGYLSTANSFDYKPWVRVSARLVSAKDHSQLYFRAFNYGADLTSEGIENVGADPKYAYRNFDLLMSKADESAEGIKSGVNPIAVRIGEQLR